MKEITAEKIKVSTIGNAIFDLELKTSNLKLEIIKQEEKLANTEIYKHLEDLKQLKKHGDKRIEEAKEKLKQEMIDSEIKSLDLKHQKITLTKSQGSLKIEDQDKIPERYKTSETVIKEDVDKTQLKDDIKALKDGEEIPGATVEYKHSLKITPKEAKCI